VKGLRRALRLRRGAFFVARRRCLAQYRRKPAGIALFLRAAIFDFLLGLAIINCGFTNHRSPSTSVVQSFAIT
jgi:hypothetical protein